MHFFLIVWENFNFLSMSNVYHICKISMIFEWLMSIITIISHWYKNNISYKLRKIIVIICNAYAEIILTFFNLMIESMLTRRTYSSHYIVLAVCVACDTLITNLLSQKQKNRRYYPSIECWNFGCVTFTMYSFRYKSFCVTRQINARQLLFSHYN